MLDFIERRLTFKPNPEYNEDSIPNNVTLLNLDFNNSNLRVAYRKKDSEYFVINTHGNRSNITNLAPGLYSFYEKTGYSYLLFDYPGYGNSPGKVSESSTYQSLDRVYDFVVNDLGYSPEKIILHGVSLGGAVAIEGLSKYPVRCGVIDSSFTNTIAVAHFLYKKWQLWRFVKPKFNSIQKIRKIKTPILFIHGTADKVIPYQMSEELFAAKPGVKYIKLLEGITHVDPFKMESPEIIERFCQFVDEVK